MKKALLTILIAALLLGCGAPAFAEVRLPAGLTEIGDEAFMNAKLTWLITIPDGVKTIGARAFSGSTAGFAYLPESVTKIAADAFDRDMTFEVLPGSYAERWCREQGFAYDTIRSYVGVDGSIVYPNSSRLVSSSFPYPDIVSAYRWEASTDGYRWTVLEGETGSTCRIPYSARPEGEGKTTLYVRCRVTVKNVLLEAGSFAELDFYPDTLAFTENTRALNADSIFLQWNSVGPGATYDLYQSVDDKWEAIASLTDVDFYTVYGLEPDTLYRFTLVATLPAGPGKALRFEPEDGINLRTKASGNTEVNITKCQSVGTSLLLEWDAVDRAVYDIAVWPAGTEKTDDAYLATDWKSTELYYYGMDPDTLYNIEVRAWIEDRSLASGWRGYSSGLWSLESGSADPKPVLESPVVRGETVSLRWSHLPGTFYTVYMSKNGGEETAVGETYQTHFDVTGLDRSAQYSFRVKSVIGNWSAISDPVSVRRFPKKPDVEYRALLIGEVNFEGEMYAARNYRDVTMLDELLADAKTPTGARYSTVRRMDLGRDEILAAIRETFRDADENDVSLFFIATHGDVDEIGREAGYLSTIDRNRKKERLRLEELAAALGEVRGTVIVWLGSCGSGAAIYDMDEPQNWGGDAFSAAAVEAFAACDTTVVLDDALVEDFTAGDTATFNRGELRQPKFYVLTAARYHQSSWGMENSVNYFPMFLRDGVVSDSSGFMTADANRDGKLTQHELFLYIKAREEDPVKPVKQDVQEYPLNSDYVLFIK